MYYSFFFLNVLNTHLKQIFDVKTSIIFVFPGPILFKTHTLHCIASLCSNQDLSFVSQHIITSTRKQKALQRVLNGSVSPCHTRIHYSSHLIWLLMLSREPVNFKEIVLLLRSDPCCVCVYLCVMCHNCPAFRIKVEFFALLIAIYNVLLYFTSRDLIYQNSYSSTVTNE